MSAVELALQWLLLTAGVAMCVGMLLLRTRDRRQAGIVSMLVVLGVVALALPW